MKLILTGLLRRGRRHLELTRSMDAAVAGKAVPLSDRIKRLWQSLRRLRLRHVRMLRALAQSKDEFGRLT
jgi:hypothetical protein